MDVSTDREIRESEQSHKKSEHHGRLLPIKCCLFLVFFLLHSQLSMPAPEVSVGDEEDEDNDEEEDCD